MPSQLYRDQIFAALISLGQQYGPCLDELGQIHDAAQYWRHSDRKFCPRPEDEIAPSAELQLRRTKQVFLDQNLNLEWKDFEWFLRGAKSGGQLDQIINWEGVSCLDGVVERWGDGLRSYSSADKVGLFCGLVIAESAMKTFSCVAPTIPVFRVLQPELSADQHDALAYWALCNRGINHYTPFGRVIRGCGPRDFLVDEKVATTLRHSALTQSQQEAASARRVQHKIHVANHRERGELNRGGWQMFVEKLKNMPAWERFDALEHKGSFPPHTLPHELFPTDSETLRKVNPESLRSLYERLLRYRHLSKGWKAVTSAIGELQERPPPQ